MIISSSMPELPDGEGCFWTHNTAGEHATKFIGYEVEYNALLQDHVVMAGLVEPHQYSKKRLLGMMMDEVATEVIFVRHQAEDQSGVGDLVSGAIARFQATSLFEKRVTVDDLVVRSDFQAKGVGGFILGRASFAMTEHGMTAPTELVLNFGDYKVDEDYVTTLDNYGFSPVDGTEARRLILPGTHFYPPVGVDYNDSSALKALIQAMPVGFNGHIDIGTNQDPRTELFRDGKLVGVTRRSDDYSKAEADAWDYELFDAGNAKIGSVTGKNEEEPLVALLNRFDLVHV